MESFLVEQHPSPFTVNPTKWSKALDHFVELALTGLEVFMTDAERRYINNNIITSLFILGKK